MRIALTRDVSPTLDRCELTHLERQPIDVGLAVAQHDAYRRRLRELGCHVLSLPAEPAHPDAVFVEDPVIVLDELAILTRPGAASRRGEGERLAAVLGAHRDVVVIESPGQLEGGDVFRLGRVLHAGLSSRTDAAGIAQLAALVAPHGYRVVAHPVAGCLHLKSAACPLDDRRVLAHRPWLAAGALDGLDVLDVPSSEPAGANVLAIDGRVLLPAAHPRTAELLAGEGWQVLTVDNSELLKAEAGVTCCSVVFEGDAG